MQRLPITPMLVLTLCCGCELGSPSRDQALERQLLAIAEADEEQRPKQLAALVAGGPKMIARLARALRSPEWAVKDQAHRALKLRPGALEPVIPELARSLGDMEIGDGSAELLAQLGAPAIPALVARADSGDEITRFNALRALSLVGAPAKGAATATIVRGLESEHTIVRSVAIAALEAVCPGRATRLFASLDDPELMIRQEAALALSRLAPQVDAEKLSSALLRMLEDDPHLYPRISAAEALLRLDRARFEPRALPVLVAALLSLQGYREAFDALVRLGAPIAPRLQAERAAATDNNALLLDKVLAAIARGPGP